MSMTGGKGDPRPDGGFIGESKVNDAIQELHYQQAEEIEKRRVELIREQEEFDRNYEVIEIDHNTIFKVKITPEGLDELVKQHVESEIEYQSELGIRRDLEPFTLNFDKDGYVPFDFNSLVYAFGKMLADSEDPIEKGMKIVVPRKGKSDE